ncbi:wall surface anchor family domain protein, partial [Chlamydia psittaci 08DC60]
EQTKPLELLLSRL